MACACSGIVVGIVNYTGIGTRLSSALVQISGNMLILGLIFTAVSCLILGMGLPTTPSYIVVATLLVPTLIKMGITTMGSPSVCLLFCQCGEYYASRGPGCLHGGGTFGGQSHENRLPGI